MGAVYYNTKVAGGDTYMYNTYIQRPAVAVSGSYYLLTIPTYEVPYNSTPSLTLYTSPTHLHTYLPSYIATSRHHGKRS